MLRARARRALLKALFRHYWRGPQARYPDKLAVLLRCLVCFLKITTMPIVTRRGMGTRVRRDGIGHLGASVAWVVEGVGACQCAWVPVEPQC